MYKFDNEYENIAIAQLKKLATAIDEVGDKFDYIEKEADCSTLHSSEYYDVFEVLSEAFEDKRLFDHAPSLDKLIANEYQNNCDVAKMKLATLVERNSCFNEAMKLKLKLFLNCYFDEIV